MACRWARLLRPPVSSASKASGCGGTAFCTRKGITAEEERERKAKADAEERRREEEEERARIKAQANNSTLELMDAKAAQINSKSSLLGLLRWISETFPPVDLTHRSRLQTLVAGETIKKSEFKQMYLFYHPDKGFHHGEHWRVACEDVTKVSIQV